MDTNNMDFFKESCIERIKCGSEEDAKLILFCLAGKLFREADGNNFQNSIMLFQLFLVCIDIANKRHQFNFKDYDEYSLAVKKYKNCLERCSNNAKKLIRNEEEKKEFEESNW